MERLPYPFPGMNPYLEDRVIWEGVHARLLPVIANQIQPLLDPRYIAAVEERVFVEGPQERIPDVWIEGTHEPEPGEPAQAWGDLDTALIVEIESVEVHQKRVEILDTRDGMKLVAVIELVSPNNKRSGVGRSSYLKKQRELGAKECHLIEIDLLRRGAHVLAVPEWRVKYEGSYDYLVCISRWPRRQRYEVYPRSLRERLPRVNIPLVAPDADVVLELQAAIEQIYNEGRYTHRLKYDVLCQPKLSDRDQNWAYEQLEKAGIRAKVKKPRAANGKKKKE